MAIAVGAGLQVMPTLMDGSSFAATGATNIVNNGANVGNGRVAITYDPSHDGCSKPAAIGPAADRRAPEVVVSPRFTG